MLSRAWLLDIWKLGLYEMGLLIGNVVMGRCVQAWCHISVEALDGGVVMYAST